ncbi:MAG: PAS domain-containing protein [Balneolaceae bacterium]
MNTNNNQRYPAEENYIGNQLKQRLEIDEATKEYLSDIRLKTLVENALDVIMILNTDGTIRFLSKSAKKISGNDPEQIVGKNIIDYLHPSDKGKFKTRFSALIQDKTKTDYSNFQVKHKNGKFRYFESISKQIVDPEDGPCVMVNARDVTINAFSQQVLEKSKEQLSVAQKIAQVGSWEWDLRQDVVRWSKELQRIYGTLKGRLITDYRGFMRYLHPGDREYFTSIVNKALDDKKQFQIEYRIIRTDGEERKILARGEVILDEKNVPEKIIATGQDITDLKNAERHLMEYSEQLKTYNAKQDMIIENERIQIARDIHDELGQMLAVLKMDVFLLKENAQQAMGEKLAAGFNDDIRSIFGRFDTLINSVQRITTNLRPEVIDDLDLVEAVKWQCKEFERHYSIDCNFVSDYSYKKDMIKEYKNSIFRILQQALKNISEHAEATKVKVKIAMTEDLFTLKVWDNGSGIKGDEVMHPNSLGLLSMRERSHYLGGDVTIVGKKNEGTTVTLEIPVNEIIFKY